MESSSMPQQVQKEIVMTLQPAFSYSLEIRQFLYDRLAAILMRLNLNIQKSNFDSSDVLCKDAVVLLQNSLFDRFKRYFIVIDSTVIKGPKIFRDQLTPSNSFWF